MNPKNPLSKNVIFIAFCFLITFPSFSQNLDLFTKKYLDSLLDLQDFKGEKPGFSILIHQPGQTIYTYQTGMANVEKKIPITDTTIFALGSVSKQFTAACIFLLEEEGKLNVNDSIQKYLPELPYFGKKITIQHLISHTSGIPDHFQILLLQGKFKKKYYFEKAVLEFYKDKAILMDQPGERFAYSNSGYLLLSIIVERVSGMKIGEYAKKNIFDPLKMKSAKFVLTDEEGMPDQTLSYELKKNKYKAPRKPEINAMGAVGVYSTLTDYLKWDQNFYDNQLGKKSKNFIDKMQTAFVLNNGNTTNYAGAIFTKPYYQFKNFEHSGGWNYFSVQFRRLPESKTTILVAFNTDDAGTFKIADQIADIVLKRNPISKIPILNNKEILDKINWSGSFIDAHNVTRKLIRKGDSLCITKFSDEKQILGFITQLNSNSNNSLSLQDENGYQVNLSLNETTNEIIGFEWQGGHYFHFERKYTLMKKEGELSKDEIKGKYYFETNAQKVKIKIKRNGKVILKPIFFMKYELIPLGSNHYQIKDDTFYIEFTPNEITIGNIWVYNLKLSKRK
jgi:CubicO group peptidase (beta-lactamase class C family)